MEEKEEQEGPIVETECSFIVDPRSMTGHARDEVLTKIDTLATQHENKIIGLWQKNIFDFSFLLINLFFTYGNSVSPYCACTV